MDAERSMSRDPLEEGVSAGRWPSEADNNGARARHATFSRAARTHPPGTGQQPVTWTNTTHATPDGPAEFSIDGAREHVRGSPGEPLPRLADDSATSGAGSTALPGARWANSQHPSQTPPSWGPPSPVPRQQHGPASNSPSQPGNLGQDSGLVRPYFRTRGRTQPAQALAVEALVSTSERGRMPEHVQVPEHRSICELCSQTRSVAEVAALLGLPLGVVRVLIGDVASLGLVLIHPSSSTVGDRPSIEFMERVLSGLRRI